MANTATPLSSDSILKALDQIRPVIRRTPLEFHARLSQQYDASIYLKREDLQVVRSYKLRGAYNLMSSLTAHQRERGVVCASAGNHAQGVAYSCRQLEMRGYIYMPQNTPRQKVERVRSLGGSWISIELVGETFDDTSYYAADYSLSREITFVHPFDDARIVAGQGTVAIEVKEQLGDTASPDFIIVPIGGGGLISGMAVYCADYLPTTQLIGAEPARAACMMAALNAGRPVTLPQIDTFVDGAAVRTAGRIPFEICNKYIREIIPVAEGSICTEMIRLYQSEGIISEPAGALSVAALNQLANTIRGKTVVCILSGGNNDISRYPEIIERSLIDQGLKHYFLIEFSQRPGALRRYLDEALGPDDDITVFEYIKKSNREYGPALVGIELSRRDDYGPLLERMTGIGLRYEIIDRESSLFRFVL